MTHWMEKDVRDSDRRSEEHIDGPKGGERGGPPPRPGVD